MSLKNLDFNSNFGVERAVQAMVDYEEKQAREMIESGPYSLWLDHSAAGVLLSWDECWKRIDEQFSDICKELGGYNNQTTFVAVWIKRADGLVLEHEMVAALWEACCEDSRLFWLHVRGSWG